MPELDDLLAMSPRQFVEAIYRRFLLRDPDADGRAFYLARLEEGCSRKQVLAEFTRSIEAKRHAVRLRGLALIRLEAALARVPVLGRLAAAIAGLEGTTAYDFRLRAVEEFLTGARCTPAPERRSSPRPGSRAASRSQRAHDHRPGSPPPATAVLRAVSFRALVERSKYFDEDWYVNQVPVLGDEIDAVGHFLAVGGLEGRSPAENFDAAAYLETYADVRRSGVNPLVHFLQLGRAEGRTALSVAEAERRARARDLIVTNQAIRCLRAPQSGGEIALLAAHAPDGVLAPRVVRDVARLAALGIGVVLIVLTEATVQAIPAGITAAVRGLFVRETRGYHFAAWAHVLQLYPALLEAPVLYLVNDGVLGSLPAGSVENLFERIRASTAAVIGLAESQDPSWHLQGEFLVLRRAALSNHVLHQFLIRIVSLDDADAMSRTCELRLAAQLRDNGIATAVMFESTGTRNPPARGGAVERHAPARLRLHRGALVDESLLRESPDAAVASPARVTVLGPSDIDDLQGAVTRGYIAAMWHAQVELNIRPLRSSAVGRGRRPPLVDCRSFPGASDLVLVCADPGSWPRLLDAEDWHLLSTARKVVCAWHPDVPVCPADWSAAIGSIAAVWAPSDYSAQLIKSALPVPVDVVPWCLEGPAWGGIDRTPASLRRDLAIPPGARVILSCAERDRGLFRANFAALVAAFGRSALAAEGWVLVLASDSPGGVARRDPRLQAQVLGTPGVIVADAAGGLATLNSLLELADVFVSAHRTNAFGMPLARAMARGRIVVATDFGGSCEWLDESCGFPVPFSRQLEREARDGFPAGSCHAEIDAQALTERLRRAAAAAIDSDGMLRDAARARMQDRCSAAAVGGVIDAAIARCLGAS